ncbi:MAG: cation:proton antiporter [Candidatus Andersenbacteria bacterium]|nr:cation:proton antiporter [Candidatus Andersenbacteria bacterium]
MENLRLITEHTLLFTLIQLAVIVAAGAIFGYIAKRLRQPQVVGQIIGGLILGPTVLGNILLMDQNWIFHPSVFPWMEVSTIVDANVGTIFKALAEIGLVLLLLLIGMEFDFSHLKAKGKSAAFISLAGILLPFMLGWFITPWLLAATQFEVEPIDMALFLGTAMSITALPILGKMMMEYGITKTKIGAVTISAAASDDAISWLALAAVSAAVTTGWKAAQTATTIMWIVLFALVVMFAVKPLFKKAIALIPKKDNDDLPLALLLVVVILAGIATHLIGIFAIFGAFFLGAVLSTEKEFCQYIVSKIKPFVTVFFLPIFFTATGLRTDIGTLESGQLWLLAAVVMAAAMFGKLVGCGLAAKVSGFNWKEAATIGVFMNTRALMELIVINVGYELGVIPLSIFCMLVMMAVVTTIMTTPLIAMLAPGTELEPHMRAAGFLP